MVGEASEASDASYLRGGRGVGDALNFNIIALVAAKREKTDVDHAFFAFLSVASLSFFPPPCSFAIEPS